MWLLHADTKVLRSFAELQKFEMKSQKRHELLHDIVARFMS